MKTMTKKGLVVLTAAVLMFAFVGQASAFCVNNNSDVEMHARQVSGGASSSKDFDKYVASGQSECCHWSNKDCNASGSQTAPLGFDVDAHIGGTFPSVCRGYQIPAGGVLYIKGSGGNYSCSQNP